MGLFDRLFGRKTGGEVPPPEERRPVPVPRSDPDRQTSGRETQRAFDTIAEALDAWKRGDAAAAERLFERGIAAYKRSEPSGLDFALGRYGAFLLDLGRDDDATRVLEQAIGLKTDIPAVWSDYVRLMANGRDLAGFTRAVERMTGSVGYRVEPEFILGHARRAEREGAADFAEAVARWVVERCAHEGNKDGRWAAIGDLGRILERAGRTDDAVKLWRDAFDEGSCDPDTANRLSMQLDRAQDYIGAIAVIQEALNRGLPANVEESLRKRLNRCQAKTAEADTGKKQKRAQVPAFSIRRESALYEPLFQIRLKPGVKDLELVGATARCLLSSKESSTLVDIDLATGAEIRRLERLPLLGDTWFAPDGRGIGIRRTASIGKGPTLLRFLAADGRVVAESSVPDATSEIALGPDLWYVGCRNGYLYGFGLDGGQRWAWETPGANNPDVGPYFRPCPYYVASQLSFAAVASMGNVYAVSPNGRTLWHAALPNERQTRWEFTIPLVSGRGSEDAFRTLGLSPDADRTEVKSAYRRLVLATHPDRNPSDASAAAAFRRVQGAYEQILAAPAAAAANQGGLTISMELGGMGPTASFLAANSAGVVVGSSQGRLYVFEGNGALREARVIGDGPVRAALRPDGAVGAAWCGDALLFLRENKVVNATEALEWPRALTMLGDDVVLWRGNTVQVLDSFGRLLWSVEFSKTVTAVAAHGDTLLCAAGVLAAFRRHRGQ